MRENRTNLHEHYSLFLKWSKSSQLLHDIAHSHNMSETSLGGSQPSAALSIGFKLKNYENKGTRLYCYRGDFELLSVKSQN